MRRIAHIPIFAASCLLLLFTALAVTPATTHAAMAAPVGHRHKDKQVVA